MGVSIFGHVFHVDNPEKTPGKVKVDDTERT